MDRIKIQEELIIANKELVFQNKEKNGQQNYALPTKNLKKHTILDKTD